jgi:hypothetical protein
MSKFPFLKHTRTRWLLFGAVFGILALIGVAFGILVLIGRQEGKQTIRASPSGNAFFVLGDNRSGDDVYQTIVVSIVSSRSSAVCLINTGDMIPNAGHPEQWVHFLKMTAPVAAIMPWYGVVGNHDVRSVFSQKLYQWVMDLPGNKLYYSFDTLNSHFIILDTEIPGQAGAITGEQLAWLKQDLQVHAPPARHTFVFTHHPPFPQGSYRGHPLANADELHQLFFQYKVAIVFSGHEHQYYTFRKDTVVYVVTGGGGAPLMQGGMGKSVNNYLLVELLSSGDIRLNVLDIHGKVMQTEILTFHSIAPILSLTE